MSAAGRQQLTSIYLACRGALSRVVGKIVDRSEVEDILQEAYVRSYEAGHRHEINDARAFLMRTATNLALNHIARSEYRTTGKLEDLTSQDMLVSNLPSLDRQVESDQRLLAFCRAVDNLPPQCRRVFISKKVYGLSQQAIARELGITESTVEKHIAKGLLLCREQLEMDTSRTPKRKTEAKMSP
jgi:RNA polymerase sigma factor (sigma-70 family)